MKTIDAQHITAAEAARRLGLTAQAIGLWAAKPGAPCTKENTRVVVRWPDFARWREDVLIANATSALRERLAKASDQQPGGDPIVRKQLADATKAEIEVALLERSVVPVDDAEAVIVDLLTRLRHGLLSFPRTAAPKILGAKSMQDLEYRLDAEIRRLMEVLSAPDTLFNRATTEPEQAA